jgi:two-component system, response regulator YesN
VLSDNWMPELSGIQLARNVKETNPNVKVLLLTGSEIIDNQASPVSPSTNVDGFVQKPISIRKLTDKIMSLIDGTKGRSSFKG